MMDADGDEAATPPGRIGLEDVQYNDPDDAHGRPAMREFAALVCELTGMNPKYGIPALVTIAQRESAFNHPRWRVNTTDGNAHGPIVSDGHPRNCSRGAVQLIPPTFAHYHQDETALTPYDVVACMSAAVNYVRVRYGVNRSGSNFAARVQQADPRRPPKGY